MSKPISLEEIIFNDMNEALKGKEKFKLSTLRMIRAAMKNAEISKKDKLTEDEVIGIITNYLKKVRRFFRSFY